MAKGTFYSFPQDSRGALFQVKPLPLTLPLPPTPVPLPLLTLSGVQVVHYTALLLGLILEATELVLQRSEIKIF